MAKYHQGLFKPRHPEKYAGDASNIVYRSGWELKCFSELDSSPDVISWGSEELVIPYYDPTTKKMRRYFVDLVVKSRQKDGSIQISVVEIKPFKETRPPEPSKTGRRSKRFLTEAITYAKNQSKWTAAKKFCVERGWKFLVLTENEIYGKKK